MEVAVVGEPEYAVLPHAMVRIPLLPVHDQERGSALEVFAADPVFAEAVWLASPSLAGDAARAGELGAKRLRAVHSGLRRYLIRASSRPTPFGGFSGVAAVGWGDRLDLRVTGGHHRFARLDFAEVLRLVKDLEASQDCTGELGVYANPAVIRRGGRLYVPWRDTYGVADHGEDLTIRCSEPVRQVLAAAPASCADLLAGLVRAYPEVPAERLRAFLASLIEQGVLLTALRPPMTVADPLAYLRAAAAGLPASAAKDRVERLSGLLAAYTDTPLGAGTPALRALLDDAGTARAGGQQHLVQADVRAAVTGTLPAELAEHARLALRALCRLSPAPARSPELRAYADAFTERYGNREVPLLDLLDEQFGLGPPAGYRNPAPRRAWAVPESDRAPHEDWLRANVFSALRDGRTEIELTEADLDSLPLPAGTPPSSVDMFVLLAAAADGWLGVLGPAGTGTPGGRSFGRFAHLCPEFAEQVRGLAEAEQRAAPDALIADLRYANPHGHANNVSIGPRGHEYQVAVACTPDVPAQRHIPLGELLVGLRGGRFYLRSARQVLLRAVHLLNPASAPNAVRFACAVSEDGHWLPHFSWGALARWPYLPRLRVGRVVLAPARWRIPADPEFDVDAWRAEFAVPRHVYLGAADHRLLLDLDDESHVDELRGQARQGVQTVQEALPGPEHAAVHGPDGTRHLAEVVLTLRADVPFDGVPPVDSTVESTVDGLSRAERLALPGEGWWSFVLHGPAMFADDLLRRIAALCAEHGRDWFFVRYADPAPQLRVRVRGGEASWLFAALAGFVDDGALACFEVVGYEREVERYGGVAGIAWCERLFCAESPQIVRLLELDPPAGLDAEDVAVFCADTLLRGLGLSHAEVAELTGRVRRGYAEEFAPASATPGDPLSSKALNRELNARRARLRALLTGDTTAELRAWADGFRAGLAPLGTVSAALTDPAAVLPSVLHMHANRLGLDRRAEYRLAHKLHEVSKDLKHAEDRSYSTVDGRDG